MRRISPIGWLVALLLLAGLACAQAGEILTPEEATRKAQEEAFTGSAGGGEQASGANFEPGQTATLTGTSFLINILDGPAGRIIAGQQRGAEVTVLESSELEGEIWYRIDAAGGEGWVKSTNLEAPQGAAEAGAESGAAAEEETTPSGLQVGDTVYTAGRSFLVNFFDQPNGRIVIGQERGVPVTIIDYAEVNGKMWYKLDAPAGEGWVPEENITAEAP